MHSLGTVLILYQHYTHNLLPIQLFKCLPVHLEISPITLISQSDLMIRAEFEMQRITYFAFYGVPAFTGVVFGSGHDVQVDA